MTGAGPIKPSMAGAPRRPRLAVRLLTRRQAWSGGAPGCPWATLKCLRHLIGELSAHARAVIVTCEGDYRRGHIGGYGSPDISPVPCSRSVDSLAALIASVVSGIRRNMYLTPRRAAAAQAATEAQLPFLAGLPALSGAHLGDAQPVRPVYPSL